MMDTACVNAAIAGAGVSGESFAYAMLLRRMTGTYARTFRCTLEAVNAIT